MSEPFDFTRDPKRVAALFREDAAGNHVSLKTEEDWDALVAKHFPETEGIAVSTAMIAAGLDAFREHHYAGDINYMLECVYRAMAYAARQSPTA